MEVVITYNTPQSMFREGSFGQKDAGGNVAYNSVGLCQAHLTIGLCLYHYLRLLFPNENNHIDMYTLVLAARNEAGALLHAVTSRDFRSD